MDGLLLSLNRLSPDALRIPQYVVLIINLLQLLQPIILVMTVVKRRGHRLAGCVGVLVLWIDVAHINLEVRVTAGLNRASHVVQELDSLIPRCTLGGVGILLVNVDVELQGEHVVPEGVT